MKLHINVLLAGSLEGDPSKASYTRGLLEAVDTTLMGEPN